ncbi:hypothetical protein [Paenibacillus wynnii]|uniref:Uncharacterized protein n=1 Tax=Paenibacillus wynnii TaxID=268407 RepID=A0A098MF01_9BACL|nr:hypothetical protein [Paenibacillus wynnii]KGE16234.1 hypothetical protein PWYN_15850 [Paenibacillus wynnii]KGE21104.1 hypothetical protein PWYN_02920 [Paenibacillus wynnii]
MMQLVYNAQTGESELVELPDEPAQGAEPEPVIEPMDAERIAALETQLRLANARIEVQVERGDFVEDVLAEMAMQVYQ